MTSIKEYERRKAQGVCTRCGTAQPEEGKGKCKVCRERSRKYMHEHYLKHHEQYLGREYKRRNTIGGKFYYDTANAKRRIISWGLSIDQAASFYTQPCHYCGGEPNGNLNGIDRQDNNKGYTIENCVPCCTTCNVAKQQMLPDEFIWHCNKVAQFNKK